MTDHTVKSYDRELENINVKIAEMGGIAEKMMIDAMEALTSADLETARIAVARDARLDALQREIEEAAVLTIARRQPMASDLRHLVGAMRIAADLERVGDLAKNIARRAIKVADDPRAPRAVIGLRRMGDLAATQLKSVLDAYAAADTAAAHEVWRRDADIDALEDSIFRDLLTFMMEDPRVITRCAHLLFCAKNIERIGDHTTNIAETIHYIFTGESLPLERPKGVVDTTGARP